MPAEGLLGGGVHEVQPQLVDDHDFHLLPLVPAVGADLLADLGAERAGEGLTGEGGGFGAAAAGAVHGRGHLAHLAGKEDETVGALQDFLRHAHQQQQIAVVPRSP